MIIVFMVSMHRILNDLRSQISPVSEVPYNLESQEDMMRELWEKQDKLV